MGCQCGSRNYGGTGGTVTSPNYPNNYANRCRCTYAIVVDNPYRIMLQFRHLDFNGNCNQDYLEVYDGLRRRENLLARFCSRNMELTTVTSQSQTLLLAFISDKKRVARGFRANYSIVVPTTPVMPTMSISSPPPTSKTVPGVVTTTRPPTTTEISSSTSPIATTSTLTSSSLAPFTSDATSINSDVTISTNSPIIYQSSTVTYHVLTDVPRTTTHSDFVTDEFSADAQSTIENFVWMLAAIICFVSLLLVGLIAVVCCVRSRHSKKVMAGNDNRDIPLDTLDDDPTVIVNRTYQSSDDFIQSNVHSPKSDKISTNSPTHYSSADGNSAVYNFPERPVGKLNYQTTNNGNRPTADSSVKSSRKYAKVSSESKGEHIYQDAGMNEIDKEENQYAGITSPNSANYQLPDPSSTTAYDFPVTGFSTSPTLPLTDSQLAAGTTTLTTHQELKHMETTSSTDENLLSGKTTEYRKTDTNEYEALSVKQSAYERAVHPSNDKNGHYLQPDVLPDEKKGSGIHDYDQVATSEYQTIDQSVAKNGASSQIPGNDTYDVVNVMTPNNTGQRSNTLRSENDASAYESFEDLKRQSVSPTVGESGYTEYKTDGKGTYQDLKPEENPLFAGRKFER
ncbi:uncharacterized protein [Apostichopus japonicus]